ncbi:MAG: DUF6291 domain-containing protein [Muribaculum sp.]|nr:DUF6291 domain-containing protein [Muribaculum sp.]
MRHTARRAPRFDREWKEMITLLPPQRQQVMEQAIRDYQLTGRQPDGLDGTEMMAFLLIKKIVDRRARQRQARRDRKTATTPTTDISVKKEVEQNLTDRPIEELQNPDKPKLDRHRDIVRHLNRLKAKRDILLRR